MIVLYASAGFCSVRQGGIDGAQPACASEDCGLVFVSRDSVPPFVLLRLLWFAAVGWRAHCVSFSFAVGHSEGQVDLPKTYFDGFAFTNLVPFACELFDKRSADLDSLSEDVCLLLTWIVRLTVI